MESREGRPTIVVTIDGLRAAALGAYGQTAYETPALDAFAAESRTYEWVYAPTPDNVLRACAGAMRAEGVSFELVTDDPRAAAALAEYASGVAVVPIAEVDSPAASIEATSMASVWEAFAAATLEALEREAAQVVWLHTRGLYGPWDAPSDLVELQLDEEDLEIEPSVVPPDGDGIEGDDADEEARFAAACRYAAQAMTLDACWSGWFDVVRSALEGVEFRVVLAGLRGFPLGEHGRVGGVDERLFSEQQHAPLVVFDGDADSRFDRSAAPLALDAAIAAAVRGRTPQEAPVVLASPTARAVVTHDWLLRAPADASLPAELYVKPDDRWEQNDIASLREGVVEELAASLASLAGAESRRGG